MPQQLILYEKGSFISVLSFILHSRVVRMILPVLRNPLLLFLLLRRPSFTESDSSFSPDIGAKLN